MGLKTRVAAAALMAAALVGSASAEMRLSAASMAWAQLTPSQREMIELVAADIWQTERQDHGIGYEQLSERHKTPVRREAMVRLGFEATAPRGVEA
jgi:hypothetical protein